MTFLLISLLGACCLLSLSLGVLMGYAYAQHRINTLSALLKISTTGWEGTIKLLQELAEETGYIPKKDGSLVSPFTVKPKDN